MPASRHTLVFTEPGRVDVREEPCPVPQAGEVLVETVVSAISPGTEMLVFRGHLPADMPLDASIPGLTGAPSYPLKYGYASVGRVVDVGRDLSSEWHGRLVFSLHPHESHYTATPDALMPVPTGFAAEHAALYPYAETAVTFLMDGRPIVGEDVAVFGQGVVGLMTTNFLARMPLASLVAVDPLPLRRKRALDMGAHRGVDPTDADELQGLAESCDLTYELSGSPAALDQAVAVTGFRGRVVIGSWYGDRPVELDLGGRFHRSRITLVSSQVSTIDPWWSGRWSKERRRAVAWRLLRDVDVDMLVTDRVPFAKAAEAYELVDRRADDAIQVLLNYEV
jgi:2-desacetyl-2-hydroxyethyl bacteriochlorophyllide A dehydrogenase